MSIRDRLDHLLARQCRCRGWERCEDCLTAAEVFHLGRNGGVGPHILFHPPSGEYALCGGSGACPACDTPGAPPDSA